MIAFIITFGYVMILFTGCSNDKQSFAEKSYEAEGTKIEEINIDVRDRQIEVSLSADHQIHIKYAESEKEYYDISVSKDNVLSMTAIENKGWLDYIGRKPELENRKIFLQIPDSFIASVKVSTTNADIKLSALNVTEDLTLSSNGGNISFEKINAGSSIAFKVKNGNITGSILGGYDDYAIACKTKKGNSNLPTEKESGSKTLSVNANNGDVEIVFCQ
ncbi:DUF4097 family beta strand repeat-containing protein [Gehongia tenuis]|nr:DUF4097 family beta strand repeat-containing protein [Gehongia tenuis]